MSDPFDFAAFSSAVALTGAQVVGLSAILGVGRYLTARAYLRPLENAVGVTKETTWVLSPWPIIETPLAAASFAGWVLLTLCGWTVVQSTPILGLIALFVMLELLTAVLRWRHRTLTQFAVAASIAVPALGSILLLSTSAGILSHQASNTVLALYGTLFFAVPWIAARRLGRAATVLLSSFQIRLEEKRLRWRLVVGPRVGQWVTVPYDGLRPRVLHRDNGVFLDLGSGEALQVSGVGRARLGRLLNTLRAKMDEGQLDKESLDNIRSLTTHSRDNQHPRVGLVPFLASLIGSAPLLLMLAFVGFGAVSNGELGAAACFLLPFFVSAALAWTCGTYLADPLPLIEVPHWFER